MAEELRRRKLLDDVGGAEFLSRLLDSVPTTASAEYYARVVAEKAILRSLIGAGSRITQIGFEPSDDVDDTLDRCEQMIFQIGRRQGAVRSRAYPRDSSASTSSLPGSRRAS